MSDKTNREEAEAVAVVEIGFMPTGLDYDHARAIFADGAEWAANRLVGDPTDEQVAVALNAYNGQTTGAKFSDWSRGSVDAMRAALTAAGVDPQAPSATYEGLRIAMLGTTDGGFIDPDSEIPAGEMFRLAAEYLGAGFPATPPVYDVAKLAEVIGDVMRHAPFPTADVIARAVIASLEGGAS